MYFSLITFVYVFGVTDEIGYGINWLFLYVKIVYSFKIFGKMTLFILKSNATKNNNHK